MKVMWIVNTLFPKPSESIGINGPIFGGWLFGLFDELKNNDKIDKLIIATTYKIKELKKIGDGKIVYYIVPSKDNTKYSKEQEKYWKTIRDKEKPDVVHIHGTEYPHSLCYINACGGNNVCTSIQGLISECGKKEVYYAGIKHFPITLRDIIKRDSVYQIRKKFAKRGIYEIEALKKSKIIIGRTNWDKSHAYSITKKDNYEKCNESLRKVFYEKTWNLETIQRHSIFISQASYPIKGFHKMIEAAILLRKKYDDLKIYVAGPRITNNEKFKITGYGKYLNNLIKKNRLESIIEFTGLLNETQMCDRLLMSHIFVQTSSIENSPNSLGEAMLIGMPCIATNVGGTPDIINDKEEGLLYQFNDSKTLAKYVSDLFENDDLAVELGKAARKHASITHNQKVNTQRMIEIYEKIYMKKV